MHSNMLFHMYICDPCMLALTQMIKCIVPLTYMYHIGIPYAYDVAVRDILLCIN